jgi:TRAP-type C4-dicarboxylate transport system permease large subunit
LLPFYIPLVCTLLIITFMPKLVLWLPKMMR